MKQAVNQGVTLLELVVASGLMGILFMSGLELLSSLFRVEARYTHHPDQVLIQPVALEARLRILLQSADHVAVQAQGNALSFQQKQVPHELHFKPLGPQSQLMLDEQTLATFKSPPPLTSFVLSTSNLITIHFPDGTNPIQIWLRNAS